MFNHNITVLKRKKGLFHVARSSKSSQCVKYYLSCSFCFQFFIKRKLYRHCMRCKLRQNDSRGKFAADGRLVLDGAVPAELALPKALSSKVQIHMHDDPLTRAVKKDQSILKVGASLLRKLAPKRADDIAQRMRLLARLSLQIAKLSSKKP